MLPLKHSDSDDNSRYDFRVDFKKRFELVTQKRIEEENLKLEKYQEKETRARNKLKQRREELSRFSVEKRMEWKDKFNTIQKNKQDFSREAVIFVK